MRYAQTNIQLFRQLQEAQYTENDLLLVNHAYHIAMQVFAGHYRPNNKPFLTHLVGVGSILSGTGQSADVIATGILHSTYALGLGCKEDAKPNYRQYLKDKLGADVENLVNAYSNRRWSAKDFIDMASEFNVPESEDRQLWIIKLADVHEEFLDAGHLYAPRKKLLHDENTYPNWLDSAIELAARLGSEEWAADFRRDVIFQPRHIPDAIQGTENSSYIIAPGLFPRRWKNRLVRKLREI